MTDQLLEQILAELQQIDGQIQTTNSNLTQQQATLNQIQLDLVSFRSAYSSTLPVQNTYGISTTAYGVVPVTGYQSVTVGDFIISLLLGLLLTIEVLRLVFRAPRGVNL